MTLAARWRYALKLASWPKLLVPALLGQALGVAAAGEVSALPLTVGLAFTLLDTAFIVLLNDWGDREVDALKRRMFPGGCSPKTIPDGILSASSVLRAGLAAGALALAVAFAGERVLGDRGGLALGALGCLSLFVAYSLPPLRLNYRGGGELLEAVGVGIALPWWNAYLQSGVLRAPVYALLGGYALLSLGSALASGLADEESDRQGGKRTFATACGNAATRCAVLCCFAAGGLFWIAVGPWVVASAPYATVALPAAWAAVFGWSARRLGFAAVTNAFAPQALYKQALHRGIWGSGVLLALLLGLGALVTR